MNREHDSGSQSRTDDTREKTSSATETATPAKSPAKKPAAKPRSKAAATKSASGTSVKKTTAADTAASPANAEQPEATGKEAKAPAKTAAKSPAKPETPAPEQAGDATGASEAAPAAPTRARGRKSAGTKAGRAAKTAATKPAETSPAQAGPAPAGRQAPAKRTVSGARISPRSIAEAAAMLAEERAARKARETNLWVQPDNTSDADSTLSAQPEQAPTDAQAAEGATRGALLGRKRAHPAKAAPKAPKPPEAAYLPLEAPLEPAAAEHHEGSEPEILHPEQEDGQEQKRRRRSRRGGRRRGKGTQAADDGNAAPAQEQSSESPAAQPVQENGEHKAAGPAPQGKPEKPAPASGEAGKPAEKPAPRQETPAKQAAAPKGKDAGARRRMFISILSGELVELVLTDNGTVQEYYVEMAHQAKIKGNIYKGVVSNVDANLQAAFIAYGGAKNGFLQIDEVHPEYYQVLHDARGRKFPPIQKALKPGQEILVQVVKEPAGTKGAFLTSYLSLPGRFLVLTPGREQIGVSRKVDNEEERSRLRELLNGLNPGADLGVIVRTVSMGASKTSLQRDLQFLKRLWKDVRAKGTTMPAPGLVYQELDLATRAIRDYLTDEVQEVWVDDAGTADTMREMVTLLFPKKKTLVHIHSDPDQTLFERFGLQKQLDQIYSRETVLPSGGRLVFDHTEALTAIDINSSRSGGKSNFEDMAYRTNLEAATTIPLQLRLRDIGGQVVVDFIEMRDREHWREVEKAVRAGMKGDRARYDVGKIGPFGMLEIVRQRLGSSAISVSTEPCPVCKGTGFRRNMEWQSLRALRGIHKLMRQTQAQGKTAATFQAEPELAFYLLNTKRETLQELERQYDTLLTIAMGTEAAHN